MQGVVDAGSTLSLPQGILHSPHFQCMVVAHTSEYGHRPGRSDVCAHSNISGHVPMF